MTTYIEEVDSGSNAVAMMILLIAVLAVVGFGIWFISYNNGSTTIIHDTTNAAPAPINVLPAPTNVNVQPAPVNVLPANPAPQPIDSGSSSTNQ